MPEVGLCFRDCLMRIAIVGAGISGLGCAWLLDQRHAVTLYEAAPRLGGHSNTVDVRHQGRPLPVDTGFIVYNEQNIPTSPACSRRSACRPTAATCRSA